MFFVSCFCCNLRCDGGKGDMQIVFCLLQQLCFSPMAGSFPMRCSLPLLSRAQVWLLGYFRGSNGRSTEAPWVSNEIIDRLSTSVEPRQKTSCFPGPFNGLQRSIQSLPLRDKGGLSPPNKLAGERMRQGLGEQMYSRVSWLLPVQEIPQGSECPQIPRAKALLWLRQAGAEH